MYDASLVNLRLGLVLFITFFSTSFATSYTALLERDFQVNVGYRCERRVFRQEFLDEIALQAVTYICGNSQSCKATDSKYLQQYNGPLEFNEKELLFLWPISEEEINSPNTDKYFLVLGNYLTSIFGVIQEQGLDRKKCVKEPDLSDMYNFDFATGYRCPLSVYSFETIEAGIREAKIRAESNLMSPLTSHAFPKPFAGSLIFDNVGDSWAWPIVRPANPNIDFIVMDQNLSLLGIVHRVKDEFLRCQLTVVDQILPRFVGRALEQQPVSIDQESVDVFQCNDNYVLSEQVLLATLDAPKKFSYNRKKGLIRLYPVPYTLPYNPALKYLYKWPMRVNEHGSCVTCPRFGRYENLFIIIDIFSNVHDLIMKISDENLIQCQRKVTTRSHFQIYLSNPGPGPFPGDSGRRPRKRPNRSAKRIRIN